MVSVSMVRDQPRRHFKQHDTPSHQTIETRTRRSLVVLKLLQRGVSELFISAVVFSCSIFILSCVAGFGAIKYSQFRNFVFVIVFTILFFTFWRNYVAHRLGRVIDSRFVVLHNDGMSITATTSNKSDFQSGRNSKNNSTVWTYWLVKYAVCYGTILLGICSISLQHWFPNHILDETTGDPYFFNLVCAECIGFCGIFSSILLYTDIVHFAIRKVGQLLYHHGESSLVSTHQHDYDYKDKNEIKTTTNNHQQQKMAQREYWIVSGSLFLSVVVVVVGSAIAFWDDPVINRVTVEIPHLSAENDGFRIVQISDLHIGYTIGKSRCQKTVNLVNKVCDSSCDVIALTGDVVDADPETMKIALSPLQQLDKVPTKLFVSGNHEHIHGDLEHVFQGLSDLGISSLANEHVRLGHEGQLVLAGVFDKSAARFTPHLVPNMDQAVAGTTPGKDVIVLLAHQPNHFASASAHGVDLHLAGHTHAGQMFPFMIGAWLFNQKFAGYYPSPRTRGGGTSSTILESSANGDALPKTGTAVYVSAGTHWYGPPIRFATHHHEITDITLRCRPSGES